MEENQEYELKQLPVIEVVEDNKKNILAVKNQLLNESMIEIPLDELIVCNVERGSVNEILKNIIGAKSSLGVQELCFVVISPLTYPRTE